MLPDNLINYAQLKTMIGLSDFINTQNTHELIQWFIFTFVKVTIKTNWTYTAF